jgi:16S rRNA (guanine(966)-N(2))-methyltransferase RsmD
LRIVSGTHKGRRFTPPKGLPVRPTTDYAKEGLFNILNNQVEIEGAAILDLFAGTGNITFEFASRGAASVLAVDQHFGCVKYTKKIAEELDFKSITALKADVFKFIAKLKGNYDIIFADPPYGAKGVADLPLHLLNSGTLNKDGLLIVEHGRELSFNEHPNHVSTRNFGNVNFAFFESLEP